METRESLSAFIDKILSGDSPLAARMALPNGRLPFSPMRNSVYKQLLKTVDPKSPYYQKGNLLKKKILNRVFPEYKTPKGWSVKDDDDEHEEFTESSNSLNFSESEITPQEIVNKNYNSPEEILEDIYKSTKSEPELKNRIQENLYNYAVTGKDNRTKEEIQRNVEILKEYYYENGDEERLKKLKAAGLSDEEALGLGIWLVRYRVINSSILDQYDDDEEEYEIGHAASMAATKALRKLPGFTFEKMRDPDINSNAPTDDKYYIPNGIVVRYVNVDFYDYDEFLAPYKEAEASGNIYFEPTMFAASGLKESGFHNMAVKFIVKPISNGRGQGKDVDKFKNAFYEDEVLYPPFSAFKVLKIEDYRDISMDIPQNIVPESIIQNLPEGFGLKKKVINAFKSKKISGEIITELDDFIEYYTQGAFNYIEGVKLEEQDALKYYLNTHVHPDKLKEYGGLELFDILKMEDITILQNLSYAFSDQAAKLGKKNFLNIYLEEVVNDGK